MFESVLMITMCVVSVFTPVLIPAMVHAIHAVRGWRRAYRPGWAARLPRRSAPRRFAVPAGAYLRRARRGPDSVAVAPAQ